MTEVKTKDKEMPDTNAPKKSSKRFLIGCGIGLFLCVLLAGYLVWDIQNFPLFKKPTAIENVAPEECPSIFHLPQSASNVSYATIPFRGDLVYEFDISEANFVLWAENLNWSMNEIEGDPVEIHRYVYSIDKNRNDAIAQITNGLTYTWSAGTHSIEAAYDRAKGRAYVFDSD